MKPDCLEKERMYCAMIFAECYANEAPVPPAWVEYSNRVKAALDSKNALRGCSVGGLERPDTEEYPYRWVERWRGWIQLERMGLARDLLLFIDNLPKDEITRVQIEVDKAKWWIENNEYFQYIAKYFDWKEHHITRFFDEAKKIQPHE
jgi:hypothetical protein